MNPKVTCFVIAPLKEGLEIDKLCMDSWLSQDYDNFDLLIHYEKPTLYSQSDMPPRGPGLLPLPDSAINTYLNCSFNRNIARKMALTTNAEYFLVLDSDVCLPKDAIKSFMRQAGSERKSTIPCALPIGKFLPVGTPIPEKHIQGGWYPLYDSLGKLAFYSCGEFVADNQIQMYFQPQESLVRVDYIGVGCMFITRKALEGLCFEHGLDTFAFADETKTKPVYAGECLAFGNRAYEKGYEMYMNGDVICEHIKENVLQEASNGRHNG